MFKSLLNYFNNYSFFSRDYFQGTFVFSLVKYTPLKFNNTIEYPWWGYALGWWFTLSSTLMVPIWMVHNLRVTPGTLRQVSHLNMNFNKYSVFSVLKTEANVLLCQRLSILCTPAEDLPLTKSEMKALELLDLPSSLDNMVAK